MENNYEHRLTEVEERTKTCFRRIDDLEKRQDNLDELVGTVKELAIREEKVEENVKEIKADVIKSEGQEVYIRENICNIFELHYSEENGKKYKHIIENVKKYVEKMMED